MLETRTYKCLACGKTFTEIVGGVVYRILSPVGVKCPHCKSKKTIINPLG